MARKKIINAILIKFRNIITSPAIKVTLLIVFVASCIISFLPYIMNNLVSNKVILYSQISLEISDDNIEIVTDIEDTDIDIIVIEQDDGTIFLEVKTQDGYNYVSVVVDAIQKRSLSQYIDTHPKDIAALTGGNITIQTDQDIVQIDDKAASFLMMLTMLFFLTMTLLVSRIGTQVAFEKGNRITETILTSITKKQLFFCQIAASSLVTIISFMIASIPMIIAYIVNDHSIASDFTFFTPFSIIAFLVHLIVVAMSLIIFSVGIGSCVKQAEDANTLSALILIPTLISYIYYIFSFDLYKGGWSFLNYLPIFSIYSIFGGILSGTISNSEIIKFCIIDIVFVCLAFGITKIIYCKKM